MGQQPSTAGKGRRKLKKAPNPDATLYDDDDDDYNQRSRSTPSGSPAPSPADKQRKLSKPDTPSGASKPSHLTLTPANNHNATSTPSQSPKSTSPTHHSKQPHSPKQPTTSPTTPPAVPFTLDSANPFLAPLDHIREEERPYQHLASISHFDVPTVRRLHTLFNAISASHTDDGIIDAHELTEAMGLDADCLLARAIFRIFDRTQTARINFRTWVTTLSALSQKASVEDKIRFSFSLYDLNDDGAIDINELRTLLAAAVRENVLDVSEAEVRQICDHTLRSVDRDGNGKVEYDEYRAVVMSSSRFVDSFTVDVPQLLESFRWKRSEVSEEEARLKANRFRGREKQRVSSEEEEKAKSEAEKAKEQGKKKKGKEQAANEAASDEASKAARKGAAARDDSDSLDLNDVAALSASGLSV